MTYCEEKGYKVGDEFVVIRTSNFSQGDTVRLIEDDGSNAPLFGLVSGFGPDASLYGYGTPAAYESLNNLEIKPDWENAPEGTTHFDPDELPEDDNRWMRLKDDELFTYEQGDWVLFSRNPTNFTGGYIKKPEYEQSVPKGAVTSDKLQKLSEESGFQIEFHPDGKVHVWDEVLEQGTAGTLDEVIELAEAKIEYAKVWAKFTWD